MNNNHHQHVGTSVRVTGNQAPAYLNGRPRSLYLEAFSTNSQVSKVIEIDRTATQRLFGIQPGEGVPFAALYLARARKKTLLAAAA